MQHSVDGVALPEQLGDFRILSLLGEGGSGVVYAARWGHREVALKVLRPDDVPTESARARFLAEAKILAGIEHPSVVKVLSFGELPDGRPYLAMEKLDGESLAARIARGPLPVADSLRLFEQVAHAVEALHRRGLIHRDLKPENVFLVGGGEYAVLLDFGIAKDLEAGASTVTQEGLVRGSPAYMAPERFFGAMATVASDVYELAVTLFSMLTGRLPWDSAADPEARLNPTRPSQLGIALPGALEPELLRALSTRPESRPASAAELLRGVRESQDDVATIAARATMDIRTRPPEQAPAVLGEAPTTDTATAPVTARRRSLMMAGVGVAVGVIGLATAAVVGLSSRSHDSGAEPPAPVEVAAEPALAPAETAVESASPPAPALAPIDPARPDGPVPAAVWGYHARDTNVLVGVAWGKLVKSALWGELRSTLNISELSAAAVVLAEECGFDPLDALEWFTLALPTGSFTTFELAAGGQWQRTGMERCLQRMVEWSGEQARLERDGAHTRFAFRGEQSLVGWPRDDVLLWTNRKSDRAWMDARVAGKRGAGSDAELAALRERIDPDAAFWIVAGDASWMDLDGVGADVPHPSAMYASIALGDDMTIDVGWRYDSALQATAAGQTLQTSLDELRKDAFVSFMISDARITSRGKDVLIHLYTDAKATRLIGKALGSTLTDSLKDFPN